MSDNSESAKLVKLSQAAEKRLKEIVKRYPHAKSAVMPALYIAQEELGWINEDALGWVAERLDVPLAHVIGVATFYTMYYQKPVGKYHIQLCRTAPCMLVGAKSLTKVLEERLKVAPGEVTQDGMWSWEEVECLGSCGSGPMVEINDVFFEHLTAERLELLIGRIEKEQPDLRYSTIKQDLGEWLSGLSKSQVWS